MGMDEGQDITVEKANLAVQQLKAAGFKVRIFRESFEHEAIVYFDKEKECGITFTCIDESEVSERSRKVLGALTDRPYVAVHMWNNNDEYGEYPEADEVAARINEKLGRKAVKPADYIEWMDGSGVGDRAKIIRACRKIFGTKLYKSIEFDDGMCDVLWYMLGMKHHGADVRAIKKTLAEDKLFGV
jgi:hypothetical protein